MMFCSFEEIFPALSEFCGQENAEVNFIADILPIPVGKIDMGLHNKIRNNFEATFLSRFIANLIYSPAITAAMTYIIITLTLNRINTAIADMQNQKAELEINVVHIQNPCVTC